MWGQYAHLMYNTDLAIKYISVRIIVGFKYYTRVQILLYFLCILYRDFFKKSLNSFPLLLYFLKSKKFVV